MTALPAQGRWRRLSTRAEQLSTGNMQLSCKKGLFLIIASNTQSYLKVDNGQEKKPFTGNILNRAKATMSLSFW